MEICTLIPTILEPAAELDRLGDEIAELSAHHDAATARLLDLIREFDARGGWNNGFRSGAAWLTWRVGLSPCAAREHVRVARALGTLPLLAQALARGELSYSKVRELTRVATPETEERLLAVGRAGTAEHVERIVRGWRRMDRKAEAREAARLHASRALYVYRPSSGADLHHAPAGTTARSMRRVIRSRDNRTASFGSVARTADRDPRSRRLPGCAAIRSRSCEHGTKQRGYAWTRTPRPRAGSGSPWTWATPSTSCTHRLGGR